MYLTKEEEVLLKGEKGWGYQLAAKIVVKLGDIFGATRLIRITTAHIAGVSYKSLGEPLIEFLAELVKSGCKVSVPTTLNPAAFHEGEICAHKATLKELERQKEVLRLYKKLGVITHASCTPYYFVKVRRGDHVSYSESSAVVYSNSLLGVWTNREGGPSALASAILGKTPNYGIHDPENRKPKLKVKISGVEKEVEYGALGALLGEALENEIPLLTGLKSISESKLKQLGAALATTGMPSMFYIDYSNRRKIDGEKLEIDKRQIRKFHENFTPIATPDFVFLGCPHCSLDELRKIAKLLRGKKIREDICLWVCTSPQVRKRGLKYARIIEKAGGRVAAGICAVVSWIDANHMLTNSVKASIYARKVLGIDSSLAEIKDIIQMIAK